MSNFTDDLKNNIALYSKSPISIQQVVLNGLEEAISGIDIVDPTNPFMYLMESACTMTYASIAKNEALYRRMYPKLAISEKDLFYHMSDTDYYGVFSTPSRTELTVMIPMDLLQKHAVPVLTGPDAGSSFVQIPANTTFTVNGLTLGLHYAIQIQLLANNALLIRYLNEIENPLQHLNSNLIPFRTVTFADRVYLELTLNVEQFNVTSTHFTLDNITSFKEVLQFQDKFLYLRAFRLVTTGSTESWVPMNVTHNQQVYDINVPTVVFEIANNALYATIPDIYQTTTGMTSVRLDLYTTRGAMELDISNVAANNFSASWYDLDTTISGVTKQRIAAMSAINNIIISSVGTISGGSDGKTYIELKDQVIYRSNKNPAPILPSDIINSMTDLDYDVVKYVDNVTDRVYVASKALPSTLKDNVYINAPVINHNVIFNLNDIDSFSYALVNNGNRVTLLPDALFKLVNNEIILSANNEYNAIEIASLPVKVNLLNEYKRFYTPYHYVLDNSSSALKMRPYVLNKPKVVSRNFDNTIGATDKYLISSRDVSKTLEKDGNGKFYYLLSFKAPISSQLPIGSTCTCTLKLDNVQYVSLTSTIGTVTAVTDPVYFGETGFVKFNFRIYTTLDVDQYNRIELSLDTTESDLVVLNTFFSDLVNTFKVIYKITPSNADAEFGAAETVELEFGAYLEGLFAPARNIISDVEYLLWEGDVPLTYPVDVFNRDSNGDIIVIDGGGSDITLAVLHAAGDTVKETDLLWSPGFNLISGTLVFDLTSFPPLGGPNSRAGKKYEMNIVAVPGQPAERTIMGFNEVISGNVAVFNNLGDLVEILDENVVYQHKLGDFKTDAYGKLIRKYPNTNRNVLIQAGILLVSANYRYATQPDIIKYNSVIQSTIRGFLENEIVPRDSLLSERTDLLFKPKGIVGPVKVIIGDGKETYIESAIDFNVRVYISKSGYKNKDLSNKLNSTIKNILFEAVKGNTLSVFSLMSAIKASVTDEVISVDVERFGPAKDIAIMRLAEDSTSFSINQRASLIKGNVIDVTDTILITFINIEE